ncbi:SACOL1771 family peroxiredoxin [Jeotgalibacillus salarius]|uniref:SACOL1771 family peroxiredoxin n=1 Tax=Jeotgalibacillus salarius TaxID=546023 RepID=A0A4Y8LDJ4_9BACL|nr:SACOL1771 family peroxiredoxin [Jeotgalibacillus salarius]TFE00362.1 SACOL1771 family peroxiredoxin [Jeotgalibacillus salarius]
MAEHTFHLQAEWPGGRNNVGTIESGNLKTEISIPPEMNGPGIGTNPDEMLLGAAATCYIITLAAKLERADISVEEMSMGSEGIVEVDSKGVITYKTIIHRPFVKAEAKYKDKIERYMEQSEQSCMISRALKGNVEIRLEKNFQSI